MKKSIFALVLGASLSAAIPAFAATRQFSTEVNNGITTGDISITLEEFELDDNGNLIPYADGKSILPNQKVSKIIKITNEAEPAWIRAKAEVINDMGIQEAGDQMLDGISELWVKQGDYYYYTEPVGSGEAIEFFKEIDVPWDWDETCSNAGLSIDVTAQAVQKVNFNPSFESENPWFGVPVESCIHSDHKVYQADESTEFAVIFENGVDGFIKTDSDFFKNFSSMMPGDTMTDSFVVGNRFSKSLSIKFRTEVPDNQSEESLKLLSDLILTICSDDKVLYTGSLSGETLKNDIVIADSLKKNESKVITYSIYMPEELQNASAMQNAKVRWIFSTEYTASSGGGGHTSTTPVGKKLIEEKVIPVIESMEQVIYAVLPKTGDERGDTAILLAIMCVSGSSLLLLMVSDKRKQRSEKEEPDER